MASRRYLKKVINSQIAEVIDNCYDVLAESPKKEEKANKIIDEAVELYDDLIGEVNDYKNAKSPSAHFNKIEEKLLKQIDSLNGKLATI